MMPGSARRHLLPLAIACGLLLVAPEALAGDALLARQLTDRGIDLQRDGQHGRALALFDAALAEVDHPKIRYFRGQTLRALARYDEALAEFDYIKDLPQVAKYRNEILAFISTLRNERERKVLEDKLDEERRARQLLEAERRALEEDAERSFVERMRERRPGLQPPRERRTADGLTDRIVPVLPVAARPSGEYPGVEETLRHAQAIDSYRTELTLAKVFTVTAVVGVSMGLGLGLNPLGSGDPSDGARQAGLALGVAGLMSGIVAAVLWPNAPPDPRPAEVVRRGAIAEQTSAAP